MLSLANSVDTSGGNAVVSIPANSELSVDVLTSGGTADNDFGLVVEHDGGAFSGTIGDGRDGSLMLRTGGGNVHLVRSK